MVVKYPLKGVFKVTAKGRDYWYAWRGPPLGPRLQGAPGSPEFHASYVEAHAALRVPDTGRFYSLVAAYKASADYNKLAPSTKKAWGHWLDRIADHFGELRIAQFERPQKIRPIIVRWRSQWADKPRTADYALQVLSRVLSHAVDPLGKLAGNPCEGIKRLYDTDRSEIIWTDKDMADFKTACTPQGKAVCSLELAHAVDLAAYTGLRLGDLIRLAWTHIGDDAIVLPTGKSRHQREAIIPLYDELRDVLARIPKHAATVLTSAWGRPWTQSGLSSAVQRVKNVTPGWEDRDLHFHDLRGTAATRFYKAGLDRRVISEIMGWEEAHVSKIIRRYVDRTAATRTVIEQMKEASRARQYSDNVTPFIERKGNGE